MLFVRLRRRPMVGRGRRERDGQEDQKFPMINPDPLLKSAAKIRKESQPCVQRAFMLETIRDYAVLQVTARRQTIVRTTCLHMCTLSGWIA